MNSKLIRTSFILSAHILLETVSASAIVDNYVVQDFTKSKSANHFNRISETKQVLKQILKQDNQIKIVQRDERISLKLKSYIFQKLFEQYTTNHNKKN